MGVNEWLLTAVFFIPGITTLLLGVGTIFGASEKLQSGILRTGVISSLILLVALSVVFVLGGFHPFETPPYILFRSGDFKFSFSLYLDTPAMIYLMLTVLFGNIVTFFSQRYMHLEPGFRRFFFVISCLLLGMHLAVLGSNLDTLFAGWEIVGLSSYLLIAYYWEREKPVQNAERVYWVYRISDVGLLMGAFFAHMVLRESSLFSKLGAGSHLESQINQLHWGFQWFLGF